MINNDVLIKVYNEIKDGTLTDAEYFFIIKYISNFRTKEHIDNYIQRIKDGTESLDMFLTKVKQFL